MVFWVRDSLENIWNYQKILTNLAHLRTVCWEYFFLKISIWYRCGDVYGSVRAIYLFDWFANGVECEMKWKRENKKQRKKLKRDNVKKGTNSERIHVPYIWDINDLNWFCLYCFFLLSSFFFRYRCRRLNIQITFSISHFQWNFLFKVFPVSSSVKWGRLFRSNDLKISCSLPLSIFFSLFPLCVYFVNSIN